MNPLEKRVIIAIVLLLAPLWGAQTAHGADGLKPDFIIGYSNRVLVDVAPKDAATAMQLYTDELGKKYGYKGETYAYDSLTDLIGMVKKGTIDFIAITALEYLQIKDKVNLELALTHFKSGKKSVKYVLLTNAKQGYTRLSDLKGKRLMVLKADDLGALYLNAALLREKQGELSTFFSSVEEKTSHAQAVMAVFFGQVDAAVTTDTAFATMVEMNPQVGRTLKVLASSPELVYAVTAFRSETPVELQQKLYEVALNLKNSPRGRQILMLFKTGALVPLEVADLEAVTKLVSEYSQLRARKR